MGMKWKLNEAQGDTADCLNICKYTLLLKRASRQSLSHNFTRNWIQQQVNIVLQLYQGFVQKQLVNYSLSDYKLKNSKNIDTKGHMTNSYIPLKSKQLYYQLHCKLLNTFPRQIGPSLAEYYRNTSSKLSRIPISSSKSRVLKSGTLCHRSLT